MVNFYDITRENKKEHYPNWPHIPDHPCRILIIGGSGSGNTSPLINLICNRPAIDKIYLHAKDPYEAKYQLLINKHQVARLKDYYASKAFTEY